MKPCFLITTLLLLFVTEYSQGCTPNGHEPHWRRKRSIPTAPEVNKYRAEFFAQKCEALKVAANGILDLQSAVDFAIRDSNWYREVLEKHCAGRDDAECWVFALEFLLDADSPLFKAAAQCICEWAETCFDPQAARRRKKRQVLSTLIKTRIPARPEANELSRCIESQGQNYTRQYPSLARYNSTSVTILLTDHYTYCRTFSKIPYEQRNLFRILYADKECPRTGPKASWRMNIKTVYDIATRKDGPIGAAVGSCTKPTSNPCIPNPCMNNGVCRGAGDKIYTCVCRGPHYGKNCESIHIPVFFPTCVSGSWTQWFDRDDSSGTGDYEDLPAIRKQYPRKACANPSAIDGRLVRTNQPWTRSGEKLTVSPKTGLTCINRNQPNRRLCSDYKVRFCCKPDERCKDENGLPYNGKCYNIVLSRLSYDQASQKCSDRDGLIAEIHSKTQQQAIHEFFRSKVPRDTHLWIAMTYQSSERNLRFRSGKEISADTFKWHDGYPLPSRPKVGIVLRDEFQESGEGMFNFAASTVRGVVCEKPL